MNADPAAGDLTTFTLVAKNRMLETVLNAKRGFQCRSRHPNARSCRQTVVQVLGAQTSRPWDKLQGFSQRDYSDYSD